jgi:hypothetical protein
MLLESALLLSFEPEATLEVPCKYQILCFVGRNHICSVDVLGPQTQNLPFHPSKERSISS